MLPGSHTPGLLSLAVQLGVGEAVNVTKNCVTIMSTSSVSRLVFVACRTNMRQFSVARDQLFEDQLLEGLGMGLIGAISINNLKGLLVHNQSQIS